MIMAGALTPRKPRSLFSFRSPPLATLRDEVEEILSRFWDGQPEWFGGEMAPSADISETDKTVEVRMDLPGLKPGDIDIQLTNNVLTVSGERKEEKEEKGRTFHRVERRAGKFMRSFALPCSVMEDKVAAEYHDGILTITMPKSEESLTRKITVKG
jgi:HSP20 family protein